MRSSWPAVLKRLVATVVLLCGGAPSAIELLGHRDDGPEPLHHIESATFRHHADQCLGAAVSSGVALGFALPSLAIVDAPAAAPADRYCGRVALDRLGRPTSRGPPTLSV